MEGGRAPGTEWCERAQELLERQAAAEKASKSIVRIATSKQSPADLLISITPAVTSCTNLGRRFSPTFSTSWSNRPMRNITIAWILLLATFSTSVQMCADTFGTGAINLRLIWSRLATRAIRLTQPAVPTLRDR